MDVVTVVDPSASPTVLDEDQPHEIQPDLVSAHSIEAPSLSDLSPSSPVLLHSPSSSSPSTFFPSDVTLPPSTFSSCTSTPILSSLAVGAPVFNFGVPPCRDLISASLFSGSSSDHSSSIPSSGSSLDHSSSCSVSVSITSSCVSSVTSSPESDCSSLSSSSSTQPSASPPTSSATVSSASTSPVSPSAMWISFGPETEKEQKTNFLWGRKLGYGSYAKVLVAKRADSTSNTRWAIKIVDKKLLFKHNMQRQLLVEYEVFQRLKGLSSFVNLDFCFQDEEFVYFGLELVANGDLGAFLAKQGKLDLTLARLYTAELIVACEQMHSRNVLHRDIKPENILLDKEWHLKLTDFGTCRVLDHQELFSPKSKPFSIAAPGSVKKQRSRTSLGPSRKAVLDEAKSVERFPEPGAVKPMERFSETRVMINGITAPGTEGELHDGDQLQQQIKHYRQQHEQQQEQHSQQQDSSQQQQPLQQQSQPQPQEPSQSQAPPQAQQQSPLKPKMCIEINEVASDVEDQLTESESEDDGEEDGDGKQMENSFDTPRGRKETFVGSAYYVSPEMLKKEGVSFLADVWAVGCILYKMLIGSPPFKGAHQALTFKLIQERNIFWPDDIDPNAKDFIDKALHIDPQKRIGAKGYQEIRAHPFFSDINWDTLLSTRPPVVPTPEPAPSITLSPPKRSFSTYGTLPRSSSKSRLPSFRHSSSVWDVFLEPGEVLVFSGPVDKSNPRNPIPTKRVLVLTNKPRLFYVDGSSLKFKGSIPWLGLGAEVHAPRVLYLHTPKRRYKLTTHSTSASSWREEIQRVQAAEINGTLSSLEPSGSNSSGQKASGFSTTELKIEDIRLEDD